MNFFKDNNKIIEPITPFEHPKRIFPQLKFVSNIIVPDPDKPLNDPDNEFEEVEHELFHPNAMPNVFNDNI